MIVVTGCEKLTVGYSFPLELMMNFPNHNLCKVFALVVLRAITREAKTVLFSD
jgi:hypothetical protein